LAIFKANTERDKVKNLIGEEAEKLTYLFCVVPRHDLVFNRLMNQSDDHLQVPEEGMVVKHIKTGEDLHVDKDLIRTFLIMTMADDADQYFSWQDQLFSNDNGRFEFKGSNPGSLWPGDGKPGLWMNSVSRLGRLIRSTLLEKDVVIPPVFNHCTTILSEVNERKARDLYWDAICNKTDPSQHEEALKLLTEAIEFNPFIAEPHTVLAQIHNHRGEHLQAAKEASKALDLFTQWGACWDKRMSWESWIAWTRVLLQNAKKNQWPSNAWGIISLGLVE